MVCGRRTVFLSAASEPQDALYATGLSDRVWAVQATSGDPEHNLLHGHVEGQPLAYTKSSPFAYQSHEV